MITQSYTEAVPHHPTDAETEAAIVKAGELIEEYQAEYESTGDFQYAGKRDWAKGLMETLKEANKDANDRT